MNHQEILAEIRRLPLHEKIELAQDTLDIIRMDVDHEGISPKPANDDEAYLQFLKVVEKYQTRYPEGFRFDREEANER